jgi:hypothetical protein
MEKCEDQKKGARLRAPGLLDTLFERGFAPIKKVLRGFRSVQIGNPNKHKNL